MSCSNNECFLKACNIYNTTLIKQLVDIVGVDCIDGLALRSACYEGDYDMVLWLLDHNANPYIYNNAPIYNALKNGSIEIIKLFQNKGVKLYELGFPMYDIPSEHFELLKYILSDFEQHNKKVNYEWIFHSAIYKGNIEIAFWLYDTYLILHNQECLDMALENAIKAAVIFKSTFKIIKLLINEGAHINSEFIDQILSRFYSKNNIILFGKRIEFVKWLNSVYKIDFVRYPELYPIIQNDIERFNTFMECLNYKLPMFDINVFAIELKSYLFY